MKKALVAGLVGLAMTSSAFAWGDREQGALAGLIIGGILASQPRAERVERTERYEPRYEYRFIAPPPVVILQQEPIIVYRRQAPTCLFHPFYDQNGRVIGYERSCH